MPRALEQDIAAVGLAEAVQRENRLLLSALHGKAGRRAFHLTRGSTATLKEQYERADSCFRRSREP